MRRMAGLVTCIVALVIAGLSPATARTAKVSDQKPPGSPTNVVATAGDGQVTVTFDAPKTGGPVDHYAVVANDNIGIPTITNGKSSPIVATGLQNNQQYMISVQAINDAGFSPASPAENFAYPQSSRFLPFAPDPPTGVTAVAGNGQATVSYDAPIRATDNFQVWGYVAVAIDLTNPGDGGQTAQVGFPNQPQPVSPSPINVGGLTNGDQYAFTVITVVTGNVDATGDEILGSAPSAYSNTVTPARAPDAPTITNVTAGDEQATVAFEPPASDGGLPITTYTVTATDWLEPSNPTTNASGPASPVVVTQLINGHPYSFTVTATNAIGTSPPSAVSNVVTLPLEPGKPPGAPTNVRAIAGDASATVSFEPPAHGGKVDTYSVVAEDPYGNLAGATGTKSPISVKGLSNVAQWSISVAAINQSGTGPAAPAENPIWPAPAAAAVPDPPTDVTVVPGNGQATISYTAPAKIPDGYYVLGYLATAIDLTNAVNGGQEGITGFANENPPYPDAPPAPITITGLTNGDLYAFSVVTAIHGKTEATGAYLTGSEPSVLSTPVLLAGPPQAPKIGKATPGDGEVTVSFSAPANDGGAPIIDYTVIAADETDHNPDSQTASGAHSPIVVRQLADGHTYTFTVVARNRAGISPRSDPTEPVVPVPPSPTPPGPPTDVRADAGDGQATVSWKAPDNTGHIPILGYTVIAFDQTEPERGGQSVAATATSATVTGLSGGDHYVFRVSATNGVGTSPLSKPSDPVVPSGPQSPDRESKAPESKAPESKAATTKEQETTTS